MPYPCAFAAQLQQLGAVLGGFDAFGHHMAVERSRQRHDGFDEGEVAAVLQNAVVDCVLHVLVPVCACIDWIELLLDRLKKTKSNLEFLVQVQRTSSIKLDGEDEN